MSKYVVKRYIPKIYKTLRFLIDDINEGNYAEAYNRINKYLKNNIESLSNKSVILSSFITVSGNTHNTLLIDNGTNPDLVEGDDLHKFGCVQQTLQLGESLVTLIHMKTTLFNALLMMQGAEVVAEYMIDNCTSAKFNKIGCLGTPPLCTLLSPERGEVCRKIAKELINRGGFNFNTFELDRATGKKTSLLETLARYKNYELLEHMLQSEYFDFNSAYEVYKFPIFKYVTPLMLFAHFGDLQAVHMLLKYNVDPNISLKSVFGTDFNAISFANGNMDIVWLLLDHGCKYIAGVTVGLTNLNDIDIINTITQYKKDIDELLSKRNFIKESLDIIKNEDIKCDLEKTPSLIVEDQGLDGLIIAYFITKDSELAEKIANMCLDSYELSLELISTLNADYIDYPNIEQLVHDLLYNPQLIHEYFLDRKKVIENQIEQIVQNSPIDQDSSWIVNGEVISINDVTDVKSHMKSNLYIKISDEILEQIDSTGLDNLKTIPQNSLGINGLKFRNDKGIIVLKTKWMSDNNIRLVSEGFYKNQNGDLMVIFNNITNHHGVENWSHSGHAQIEHYDVDIIGDM